MTHTNKTQSEALRKKIELTFNPENTQAVKDLLSELEISDWTSHEVRTSDFSEPPIRLERGDNFRYFNERVKYTFIVSAEEAEVLKTALVKLLTEEKDNNASIVTSNIYDVEKLGSFAEMVRSGGAKSLAK